jgi:hypothetical protein
MNWIMVICLASSSQPTIYDRFQSEEQCLAKQETVTKALNQTGSNMRTECRKRGSVQVTKQSEVVVSKYVVY